MPYYYAWLIHHKSCIEPPQQNGVMEHEYQHILNVARALRFQAELPLKFWSDRVLTVVHLINILPRPKAHINSF